MSCYSIDRTSKRNWTHVLVYFLQVNLSNASICYNDSSESNMTYAKFLSSVSMSLIGGQSSRKRKGRPVLISARKQSEIQRTLGNNKPSAAQFSAHMPVAGSRGRCKYCSTRASPVFSSIKCNFCDMFLFV